MKFKNKKIITKLRSFTSIFLALIMLSTSFTFRILAKRSGIMKNFTMADSVVTSNQTISIESIDDEDKKEELKDAETLEDNKNKNEEILQKDEIFLNLTNGEKIKYISLENDILSFSMTAINNVSKEISDSGEVYNENLTTDAVGIYSNKYTRLPENAYNFTKITVPGKNEFSYLNGKNLLDEKCILTIKALSKGKTRKFKNYETIYEGEWKAEKIVKELSNVKAVRVEISGLKGEINKFNYSIEGNADISDYLNTDSNIIFNNENEYKTCYVIVENFSECIDKDKVDLSKDFAGSNYLNSNLYTEDYNEYEKPLLRTYNNLKVQEQIVHTVILAKFDGANGKLLENAEYGLYTNAKININDKTYMPGELIESNFTNKKGEIKFEIYGFIDNFYIKEIAPPVGYNSSDSLFKLCEYEQIVETKDGIKIVGKSETEDVIRINAYDEKKKEDENLNNDTKLSSNTVNTDKNNKEGLNGKQKESSSLKSDNEKENNNLSTQTDKKKNETVEVNTNNELKINKVIKADSLVNSHGDASFVFKISSKNEKNNNLTLYRVITFSEEDKRNVTSDGNIEKSVTIAGLQNDTYEITEEVNSRYVINHIIPIKNASVNGNVASVNLDKNDKGEITFKSNKNKNSMLSDSKIFVGKF